MTKGWNYDFSGVENGFYAVAALHAMGKKIASSEVLNNALSHELVAISNGRIVTLGDIISIDIDGNTTNLIRAGGVFSNMRGRLPIALHEYDSPAFFARSLNPNRLHDSVGLFAVYQDGRRLLKQYYSWRVNHDTLERIFRLVGNN